jgi:gallate dioxygenase
MRKEYSGIPATTVFDGEQSRRGYHLNQFCMSLLNPANRDRFKVDEEAYLSEWNLTETQMSAVLRRDYNAMIAEGGNIYFLGKIGATDGKSFVQLAASMTGMTPESYTAMMVRGGRAPGAPHAATDQPSGRWLVLARISAGIGCSHVPAIGAAIDLGKTGSPTGNPCSMDSKPPGMDVEQHARRRHPCSTTIMRPPSASI